MNDSTRRALRTIYHVTIAACAAVAIAVPLIGDQFPQAAAVGGIAIGIAGLVSKIINRLEDAGLVPAWLKDNGPKVEVDSSGKHVAT